VYHSQCDASRLGHTRAVGWICLAAIFDVPTLDVLRRIAHCPSRIVEQRLLLFGSHLAAKITRLVVVVIFQVVVIAICRTFDLEGRVCIFRPVCPGVGRTADFWPPWLRKN
jgi:hypothetical protein